MSIVQTKIRPILHRADRTAILEKANTFWLQANDLQARHYSDLSGLLMVFEKILHGQHISGVAGAREALQSLGNAINQRRDRVQSGDEEFVTACSRDLDALYNQHSICFKHYQVVNNWVEVMKLPHKELLNVDLDDDLVDILNNQ